MNAVINWQDRQFIKTGMVKFEGVNKNKPPALLWLLELIGLKVFLLGRINL